MEYKTLGKTGLKVSRMGFGGIPIQKIDEEGTRKLLQDMVKRGINYIRYIIRVWNSWIR